MPRSLFITLLIFFSLKVFPQDTLTFINLGKHINTQYDEVNPLISPDGKTIYFIRNDHPKNTFKNMPTQDIWYSVINNEDSTWSEAKHADFPFNQRQFNAVCGISPSGKTLLIKGAYRSGKYKGRGYSFSHYKRGKWTLPEMLKIEDIDKMSLGIYNGAYLSADGKILLMYFSEVKGDRSGDLYVSFLKQDQTWTKPKNLGKDLNTPYLEASPFLATDGKTLYFTSTRPGGYGDADIYRSVRLDNSWESWSSPENLGEPINSEKRETYYSISASGDYGYMVIKPGKFGKSDIIKIKMEEKQKPEPVVLVYGKVLDTKTGKPINKEVEIKYESLSDETISGTTNSDAETGDYKIILPKGSKFIYFAGTKGYLNESESIDLSELSEYSEIKKDLKLVPIEKDYHAELSNLFFKTGSSEIEPASYPELNRLVELMKLNPKLIIEIEGHTDNIGEENYNMALSTERAKAVRLYLLDHNIPSKRVSFIGYGETKALADNNTEEGRSKNRRVEFKILEF